MRRQAPHRLIIGIAAALLTTAAAGVALARPDATATSPITAAEAKRIAKSVANAEITRRAPRLSVKSARTAGTANAPALYAQVTGSGTVTASSQGIAQQNIVHPARGIYCFSGLSAAPKGGIAVLDGNPALGAGADVIQVGIGTLGRCPAGTQAFIGTVRQNETLVDDPFFVVLWS